jgi:hypothetical protein
LVTTGLVVVGDTAALAIVARWVGWVDLEGTPFAVTAAG